MAGDDDIWCSQSRPTQPADSFWPRRAKARACWTVNTAVQEAVQILGGMGMTDDVDMGLFMERASVLQELFDDAGFHVDRIATLGGY